MTVGWISRILLPLFFKFLIILMTSSKVAGKKKQEADTMGAKQVNTEVPETAAEMAAAMFVKYSFV